MDLSLFALTAVLKIRNSVVEMELPPEDDVDYEYQIELTKRNIEKSLKEEASKAPLIRQ